jgi:hypothetical protein
MDITTCTKEELAQAVIELTIELGKTRRALKSAMEVAKMDGDRFSKGWETMQEMKKNAQKIAEAQQRVTGKAFPAIDPMAVDARSIV